MVVSVVVVSSWFLTSFFTHPSVELVFVVLGGVQSLHQPRVRSQRAEREKREEKTKTNHDLHRGSFSSRTGYVPTSLVRLFLPTHAHIWCCCRRRGCYRSRRTQPSPPSWTSYPSLLCWRFVVYFVVGGILHSLSPWIHPHIPPGGEAFVRLDGLL